MFDYCCDHATIVAPRQPFSMLIEAAATRILRLENSRVPLLPDDSQPEGDHSDDCSAVPRTRRNRRTPTAAESRAMGRHESRPQTLRSPGGDHADNCKLQRLTSNVFEGGSRHFCAAGTFCARFRHATTKPRTQRVRAVLKRPPQSSLISLYRTMPYAIYRRQFDCCRKCADALRHKSNCCLTRHNSAPASRKSAARSSSRGPVWLSSSSARVRSHASRLARAHHQDSQDSVVVVCSP